MPLKPFILPLPADTVAWEARKVAIRSTLYQLLGDMPLAFTPQPRVDSIEKYSGYQLEKITFRNGLDDVVPGYVLVPDEPNGGAVLYCHYHGAQYDLGKEELFQEPLFDSWANKTPRGVALVQAGYVVLAIDAYAFGERQHQGPAGERESGRDTENALFKRFLWEGRTLWGMIVHDDLLALNYLLSRPEVDPTRVAVTGASMGASRTTWLAALDDRIRVTAPVIQYTRYQNLIASGGLNCHSFYYYIPGVLKAGLDMEGLAAVVAPRPQIVLVGGDDALSPLDGINIISDFTHAVYTLYGAGDHFVPHIYPGVGHEYTEDMFVKLLDYLERFL